MNFYFARPLAIASIFLLGCLASAQAQQEQRVVSVRTDTPPVIDGQRDEAWAKATPVTIELNKIVYVPANYKGLQKTSVAISSLHDKEYVYFLLQWKDPDESLAHQPWVKQEDGSWKQKTDMDQTGRENVYAEDKLAMLWSMGTPNFDVQGCAIVCHRARGGKIAGIADKSPGRKYTNKAGSVVDMWEWRAARSNPLGQVEDGYIDDGHDPAKNPDWGRNLNSGAGGATPNVNAGKNGPAFMSQSPDGKYWVRDDQKVPFADTFKAGDMVGSVVLAPLTGARGNIAGSARWNNGRWTLEIKRKLTTGAENAKQDVQFSDLKKPYYFGVSVFDHSDSAHMYYDDPVKLVFK